MGITYRRPTVDEAEAFARLHVQCWRETYEPMLPQGLYSTFTYEKRLPLWREVLPRADRFVLGAYVDGEPAGAAIAGVADEKYVSQDEGHLWALYVLEKFKRRGIGRALISLVAADWKAQGGRIMTIGVLRANEPACKFYESVGARRASEGHYDWDGFILPDCIYVLEDLAKIAKV